MRLNNEIKTRSDSSCKLTYEHQMNRFKNLITQDYKHDYYSHPNFPTCKIALQKLISQIYSIIYLLCSDTWPISSVSNMGTEWASS